MGPNLELQKWITPYSLIFFLRSFLKHHNFLSFVSSLVYQNNNNNKKIYPDCWVIKCPSCSHPPSLPGWRSQPVSAFSNWHKGKFSSRSIWLTGRLPRQWCWQLPPSLARAVAEDTLLGQCPLEQLCPPGPWHSLGCTRAHPEPAPAAPEQQIPANPSSWSGCAFVTLWQWLDVFCSGVPDQSGLELHLHQCKVTCKTPDAIEMTKYL